MLKRLTSGFWGKAISVLGTRGLLLLLSLLTSIIIARMLGPEGRGLLSTALIIGGFGSMFMNLGLHSSSRYVLVRYPGKLGGVWGNVLALSIFSVLPAFFVYIVLTLFPSLMDISGLILALACASVPLLLYNMLQLNVLMGMDQILSFNVMELMTVGAQLILLLLFFKLWEPGVELAYSANMLACLLSGGFASFCLVRKFHVRPRPDFELFKSGFGYGLKSYAVFLLGYVLIKCNILMVNGMFGSTMTGYYAQAAAMADILFVTSASLGMILFNKTRAIETDSERRFLMKRVLMVSSLFMFLILSLAGFLAEYVIVFLYGDEFMPSVNVFRILLPGTFFNMIAGILSNYFAAKNMMTGNIMALFLACIVGGALNLILMPGHELAGAAAAFGAACFVRFGIMIGLFAYDNHRQNAKTQHS